MSLFIGSTVINVAEIEPSKKFWAAALNYVVRAEDETFVVLTDPNRPWSNISLQLWEEPRVGRNRLHLDLYSDDQMGEVARLESIGARRLKWDYPLDADYIVMADPDGNEFCVIDSPHSQW